MIKKKLFIRVIRIIRGPRNFLLLNPCQSVKSVVPIASSFALAAATLRRVNPCASVVNNISFSSFLLFALVAASLRRVNPWIRKLLFLLLPKSVKSVADPASAGEVPRFAGMTFRRVRIRVIRLAPCVPRFAGCDS